MVLYTGYYFFATSILATAYVLHIVSNKVISVIDIFVTKLSSKKGEV